jgi:hypothetical protein
VRCLALVLKSENVRHMLAAGLDRNDIVVEDTIKMGALAQSCLCPGFSTVLSNLGSCLSIESKSNIVPYPGNHKHKTFLHERILAHVHRAGQTMTTLKTNPTHKSDIMNEHHPDHAWDSNGRRQRQMTLDKDVDDEEEEEDSSRMPFSWIEAFYEVLLSSSFRYMYIWGSVCVNESIYQYIYIYMYNDYFCTTSGTCLLPSGVVTLK